MISEAIILAGGLGTRVQKQLNGTPKPMAKIFERPFIEWQIIQLKLFGVKKIIISTGYNAKDFYKYFSSRKFGVILEIIQEEKPLGTGGGLIFASEYLISENFIALNGDSLSLFDINKLLQSHENNEADFTLVSKYSSDNKRYGALSLDGDVVKKFKEKSDKELGGFFSVGFYCLNKNILSDFNHNEKLSLEYDFLPKWLSEGRKIYTHKINDSFIDIGLPETLAEGSNFVKNNINYFNNSSNK
jgi:D-glycero-alpha-D-manno-heptose 1-phosphate guanylyltransferase